MWFCWVVYAHSLPYESRGEEPFEARIWNEILTERNNSMANICFNQRLNAQVIDQKPPSCVPLTSNWVPFSCIGLEMNLCGNAWLWIRSISQTSGLWRLKRDAMKETRHSTACQQSHSIRKIDGFLQCWDLHILLLRVMDLFCHELELLALKFDEEWRCSHKVSFHSPTNQATFNDKERQPTV